MNKKRTITTLILLVTAALACAKSPDADQKPDSNNQVESQQMVVVASEINTSPVISNPASPIVLPSVVALSERNSSMRVSPLRGTGAVSPIYRTMGNLDLPQAYEVVQSSTGLQPQNGVIRPPTPYGGIN